MNNRKNFFLNNFFEIPDVCLYFFRFLIINIVIFSFFRLFFFISFYEQFKNIELLEILKSFIVGIKYDSYVINYGISLFFIFGSFPYIGIFSSKINKILYSTLISLVFWFLYILEVGNVVFYKYCNTNLNFIVIEYIRSFKYVVYMVFKIFSLKFFFIFLIIVYLYIQIFRIFIFSIKKTYISHIKRLIFFICFSFILFLGLRGGTKQGILGWGEAFFSKNDIINHMTMNPIFYLSKDLYFSVKNKNIDSNYSYFGKPSDAINIAKEIFLGKDDKNKFLFKDYPFYREIKKDGEENKYNVVLILLESFTAEYIGIMGSNLNISPYFDDLSKKGALFTNFYSAGQRTNAGISSTLCSYIATPGHSMMVRMEGMQKISSIASILKDKSYETAFVYGGDTKFDNMNGFLKGKGFDIVIGEEDFKHNQKLNKWGVEDKYVFNKSIEIMDNFYNNNHNFMIMLLTLTNHPPFTCPDGDYNKVNINKDFDDSYNTFKYTDYCLGKFFEQIQDKPYFKNTIFIICGDHGQTLHYDLSFDYRKSYVPCLFYAPYIISPSISNKLTSQIDIGPTILNFLNISTKNSFLGKDMFKEKNNRDFAFIVSGSDIGYLKGDFFYYLKIGSGKNGSLKKVGDFFNEYKNEYPEIFNLMNIESRAILESTYNLFKNKKITK